MTNSKQIFTIIFLFTFALTENIDKQLASNEKYRSKFLASYTSFENPSDKTALQIISEHISPILGLEIDGSVESAQSWIQYCYSQTGVSAEIIEKMSMNEDVFINQLKEYIAERYPGPNDSEFERNGDGYMTMIPYVFNHLRKLISDFAVAKLKSSCADSSQSTQFNVNNIVRELSQEISLKVEVYAEFYNTEFNSKTNKRSFKTQEGIDKYTKIMKDLNFRINDYSKGMIFADVNFINEVFHLLRNLPGYLGAEAAQLFLLAQKESFDKSALIATRIAEIYSFLVKLEKLGHSKAQNSIRNAENDISNAWLSIYARKQESSEDFATVILPEISAEVIKVMTDSQSAKYSLKFASDLISKRTTISKLSNANYVRTNSFYELPDLTQNQLSDDLLSVLHIWNVLIDLEWVDTSNEKFINAWAVASKQILPVLSLSNEHVNALMTMRYAFYDTVLDKDAVEGFYQTLYGMVLATIEKTPKEELHDNLVSNLDKTLNETFEIVGFVKENYLLFKVHLGVAFNDVLENVVFVKFNENEVLMNTYFNKLKETSNEKIMIIVGVIGRKITKSPLYANHPLMTLENIQALSGQTVKANLFRVYNFEKKIIL